MLQLNNFLLFGWSRLLQIVPNFTFRTWSLMLASSPCQLALYQLWRSGVERFKLLPLKQASPGQFSEDTKGSSFLEAILWQESYCHPDAAKWYRHRKEYHISFAALATICANGSWTWNINCWIRNWVCKVDQFIGSIGFHRFNNLG